MATSSGMPLFYQKPQVLHFDAHKDMGVVSSTDYSFTANATAIPLSVSEFMPVIRHYPIVFIDAEGAVPVAITGIKQGRNLMVGADGAWEKNTYIPAYIRRYPFILVQAPDDKDRRILAFETTSGRVKPLSEAPEATPLFKADGQPSEAIQPMMQLCELYHQHRAHDADFLQAVMAADILVSRHADFEFSDKSHYRLDGFQVVDPERYRALPVKTIREWNKNGWTDAIALHLASAQNWGLLLERNHQRPTVN